jgi:hypothetical protein
MKILHFKAPSQSKVPPRISEFETITKFGVVPARGYTARRWAVAVVFAMTTAFQGVEANGAYRLEKPVNARGFSALFGPRLTTATDWLSGGVIVGKEFRLDLSGSLYDPFRWCRASTPRFAWDGSPTQEPPLASKNRWVSDLYWHVDENEVPLLDGQLAESTWLRQAELPSLPSTTVPNLNPYESIAVDPSVGLASLLSAPRPAPVPVIGRIACPIWRQPRKVTFYGLGGEGDSLAIFDCEGVVSADAMDRLSVIGRQPGTPLPSLPLPISPLTNLEFPGEWIEGVHLLHPRLLDLVQQVAWAFPGRGIVVYSGYRRDASPTSPHLHGRALDITVRGIPKEQLFAFCRTLHDAGCGYYPNQPFVHIDVRQPTQGSMVWVDISLPGQPSVYVDAWPGVVASGALNSPLDD